MDAAESLDAQPIIRGFRESDRDFIEASWLMSYRGAFKGLTSDGLYFKSQRQLIQRLLERPGVRIAVAVVPDYIEAILGYVVAEPQLLHYTYVKGAFQRLGIARSLLDAVGLGRGEVLYYSHVTKRWAEVVNGWSRAEYMPWAAMGG